MVYPAVNDHECEDGRGKSGTPGVRFRRAIGVTTPSLSWPHFPQTNLDATRTVTATATEGCNDSERSVIDM